MVHLAVWLHSFLVKRATLSDSDRNALTVHILDKLSATPLGAILTYSDGEILVRGEPIDREKMLQLREGARLALDNPTLKLIREQVTFESIALGVHNVESERQMTFARAALWWHQQEEKHLRILAQRQEPALQLD